MFFELLKASRHAPKPPEPAYLFNATTDPSVSEGFPAFIDWHAEVALGARMGTLRPSRTS